MSNNKNQNDETNMEEQYRKMVEAKEAQENQVEERVDLGKVNMQHKLH
jgi:hypothetical protein